LAAVLASVVIPIQSAQAQTFTLLYSFGGGADGNGPNGLTQATNGDFYGTTFGSGAYGYGTVFKITPAGKLTTLYSFCSENSPTACADGANSEAGLIQASNGDFYGVTNAGGATYWGTVLKITPSGAFTTLYSFCSQTNCTDGGQPLGGLIQPIDGELYGATQAGGASDEGTVFKMTPSGTPETLYSFCSQTKCSQIPDATPIQATNGDFYGTTADGGGASEDGTVLKMTPGGAVTTLYSFCSQTNCADGSRPIGGLVQATNGDFYGTTYYGGASSAGTVFKITPGGTLTTLHSFCYPVSPTCADGGFPTAGVIQATNGDFYGTTIGYADIDDGYGTVFRLSEGLGPFVETQTTSGLVGAAVTILGTDLTGATSVTFNGTPAAPIVVSATDITTKVPTGATSGYVEVTTPRRHAQEQRGVHGRHGSAGALARDRHLQRAADRFDHRCDRRGSDLLHHQRKESHNVLLGL
jgi:uncharacterized repeat protein (TIGR03803 family)